ncbi:MAG: hypothetical protein IJA62_03215 [Ruminococcus sp.]|nr:hypothetical protein [Ruminococcus sp.]
MNEKEAWRIFTVTGSVKDYLHFKSLQEENTQNKKQTDASTNEISDHGTYHQTTEYR